MQLVEARVRFILKASFSSSTTGFFLFFFYCGKMGNTRNVNSEEKASNKNIIIFVVIWHSTESI